MEYLFCVVHSVGIDGIVVVCCDHLLSDSYSIHHGIIGLSIRAYRDVQDY